MYTLYSGCSLLPDCPDHYPIIRDYQTSSQVEGKRQPSLSTLQTESETEKVIFMLTQRWGEKERRRRREQASDDERDKQYQKKKGK
jgi:hypothetical protein